MEMYLNPLITCIPGLISNAPDDSKVYLLEVWLICFSVYEIFYADALVK
jgi:pre-rRNA-processing protein IPI1